MLDGQRGVKGGDARRFSRRFGGRVAALALALVPACGGMADGVAPGDGEDDTPLAAGGGGPASSPGRPSRREPSATRSVTCYSPDELESSLELVFPLLPRDAFDSNGCVSASYSAWLVAGGCSFDADGASLRGGQCCYELDDPVAGCPRESR